MTDESHEWSTSSSQKTSAQTESPYEKLFIAELRKALLDQEKLNEYTDRSEQKASEKTLLIEGLENERKKARKKIETLIELNQNEQVMRSWKKGDSHWLMSNRLYLERSVTKS